MNDFTKEELMTIKKCIRLCEMDYGENELFDAILYKIKMQESVSEHKA